MEKLKQKFIEKFYLIIPFSIILFLAYLPIFRFGYHADFMDVYYKIGIQVLQNPESLYKGQFYYFPFVAYIYAFTFCWFEPNIAFLIWYFSNLFFAILITKQLDDILLLKGIEKVIHRLLFLVTLVFSKLMYDQFYHNQSKLVVASIFLLVIKNEIKKPEVYSTKLLNYGLMVIGISFYPSTVFLLVLYYIYDVIDEPFIEKIKKLLFIILILVGINFLFLIYPNLIIDYIQKGIVTAQSKWITYFYLRYWLEDTMVVNRSLLRTVFMSIFLASILFLALKKYNLETKFGLSSLSFMYFGPYMGTYSLIIPYCLILVFLSNYYTKINKNLINFILLILFMISMLLFIHIYSYFLPFILEFPYLIIYNLTFIALSIIMVILLFKIKMNEELN